MRAGFGFLVIAYFLIVYVGVACTIRTDHSSLRWLNQIREPDGQVHKWLEQLSQFDYSIIHRSDLKHRNAESMSKLFSEIRFCVNSVKCKKRRVSDVKTRRSWIMVKKIFPIPQLKEYLSSFKSSDDIYRKKMCYTALSNYKALSVAVMEARLDTAFALTYGACIPNPGPFAPERSFFHLSVSQCYLNRLFLNSGAYY